MINVPTLVKNAATGAALWSASLALPARPATAQENDQSPAAASKETGLNHDLPEPIKTSWTRDDLLMEIGGVKGVLRVVDRSIAAKPEEAHSSWPEDRQKVMAFLDEAERALKGKPDAQVLNAYGRGLQVIAALLPAQQQAHPTNTTAPLGGTPMVGTFGVEDFVGAQMIARAIEPHFEKTYRDAFGSLDDRSARMKQAIGIISTAQNPVERSERLLPLVDGFVQDFMSLPKEFRDSINPEVTKEVTEKFNAIRDKSDLTAWSVTYDNFLQDNAPAPGAAGASVAGHERRSFERLIATAKGRSQVQAGAAALKEELTDVLRKERGGKDLGQLLGEIASTPPGQKLPGKTFDAMKSARQIFGKNAFAEGAPK